MFIFTKISQVFCKIVIFKLLFLCYCCENNIRISKINQLNRLLIITNIAEIWLIKQYPIIYRLIGASLLAIDIVIHVYTYVCMMFVFKVTNYKSTITVVATRVNIGHHYIGYILDPLEEY